MFCESLYFFSYSASKSEYFLHVLHIEIYSKNMYLTPVHLYDAKIMRNYKKKNHHNRNVIAVANNVLKAENKTEGLTKPIL